MPDQGHGNPVLEVSLILLSTILTIIVAIPAVKANFEVGKRLSPSPEGNEIVINVTGYQWWWAFEYPGRVLLPPMKFMCLKTEKLFSILNRRMFCTVSGFLKLVAKLI